jgi:O-antigen/teichoic acid export membrane protein
MSDARTIWSNFSHLSLGHIAARVIGYTFTIAMARRYGEAAYGSFTLAYACTAVAIIAADFGLDYFLMKLFSDGRAATERVFPPLIRMKLVLCGSSFLGVNAFALMTYGEPTVWYVMVLSMIVFPDAVYKTVTAYLRAFNDFAKPSRVLILMHVGRAILAVVIMFDTLSIEEVCFVLVALEIGKAGLIVRMAHLSREQVWAGRGTATEALRPILRGALPYALGGLAGALLWQMDLYLISYFKRMEEVGVYAAANSVVVGVVSFFLMLATAIFPTLSDGTPGSARTTLPGILRMVLPISTSIAAVLFAAAPFVGASVFKMPDAVPILRILCWTVIPISIYSVLTPYVYRASGAWELFYVTVGGLALMTVLDAWLLPNHGIWIASTVDLLVEWIILGVYLMVFRWRVRWST